MKKIIIIIIFISLLFGLFGMWQTAQGVDLLLEYPTIKETTPTSEGLPGFIKYIYLFALGTAGIVALLAMLIGAVMYIFSAGKPDKAADAKNRIYSALLGILILLASVLILRTINPDLVNIGLTLPKITPVNGNGDGEEIMWYCYGCCGTGCELSGPPLTGCKSLGTMTANEAATTCENLVKAECGYPLVGYNSRARTQPCP